MHSLQAVCPALEAKKFWAQGMHAEAADAGPKVPTEHV
jgi:hypothetical protein